MERPQIEDRGKGTTENRGKGTIEDRGKAIIEDRGRGTTGEHRCLDRKQEILGTTHSHLHYDAGPLVV